MKFSQWLLLLFPALSLVSAFTVMKEGLVPVVFVILALIASTCAQSLHEIHKKIDQIESREGESPE